LVDLVGRLLERGFNYGVFLASKDEEFDIDPFFRNFPDAASELEEALRRFSAPDGFAEARYGKFKLFEFRYWCEGKSELNLIDPQKLSDGIPIFEIGDAIAHATTPADLLDLSEGIIEMFEGVEPEAYRYYLRVESELVLESVWDGDGFKADVYTARPLVLYAVHLAKKTRPLKIGKITPMDILRMVRNMVDAIRELGRLLERYGKRVVAYGGGQEDSPYRSRCETQHGPDVRPVRALRR